MNGKTIENQAKIVRPSQLIRSVGLTVGGARGRAAEAQGAVIYH